MYEFFIDFLFNLINNSGWRHVSPVTRCWPGRGAAGEDISIVIAGLVSCPSDIHYFVIMTIHQNINYVMTLWNHSGISIYPCFLERGEQFVVGSRAARSVHGSAL